MAFFSISSVKVSGIGACVPRNEFYNRDYDWISEKERNTLIKTIGVEKKRHASKGIISSDLCYEAADKLLNELNWNREEIDILIFISQTRDYIMPATACILQDRLKLSKNCLAFDLDLGCSGYVYGLSVIYSMISAGHLKKGLLLTGEVPVPNISYQDKSTYPLFGDAGAATAVEFEKYSGQSYFNLQTDGSGYKAIHIPDGGMRNYLDPESSFKSEKISDGLIRNRLQIALDGMSVFNFTLKEVRPNINTLLEKSGMDKDNIDYFVFHQANKLMNETIRKQLKIEPEKYLYSIDRFGNTSSVSIPLTVVTEFKAKGKRQKTKVKEDKYQVLFSGFGVGLSWGSCITELDDIVIPDLIEID